MWYQQPLYWSDQSYYHWNMTETTYHLIWCSTKNTSFYNIPAKNVWLESNHEEALHKPQSREVLQNDSAVWICPDASGNKERRRNGSRLRETRDVPGLQVNAMCSPGPGPFAVKDRIKELAWSLWIRWELCINLNFLILMLYCYHAGGCPCGNYWSYSGDMEHHNGNLLSSKIEKKLFVLCLPLFSEFEITSN